MSKYINMKLLALLAVIIILSFLYWEVVLDLIKIWENKEEYSHGFLIPIVTLYLIWQRKNTILAAVSKPSWLGILLILFGIALYFIGSVGSLYSILRFSLLFIIIGISLLFVGYKSTRLMLIPILLLVFSFPLPPVLESTLTAKLQLISSQLGVFVIRACDIPVFLEGNVIDLGSYKLQVVEACSGLRYLFPLMSLSFICAYMFHVALWKRVLVFLTSIPITILMNSFRIGIIGVLVDKWGTSMAEGFLHDFEGWTVFMGCMLLLILEMWLLSWKDRKTTSWEQIFGLAYEEETEPLETESPFRQVKVFHYGFILASLALTLLLIKPLGNKPDVYPDRKLFSQFPINIGQLKGSQNYLTKDIIDFLGLTDYILVDYSSNNHKSINFYVAYYQTQKHGAIPHSPKLCIPGGGWQIKQIEEIETNGSIFNRVVIAKADSKQLVYYWYRHRGVDIANEYLLKLSTLVGSFKHNRTDGALLRLTTPIYPDESAETADSRLSKFKETIEAQITDYVPS